VILKARYVVPVEGPCIENGAIAIERGRIAAIGPGQGVGTGGVTDYGDAVICPGFVNAHTHLELSALAGRVPPSRDFVNWLSRLVATLDTEPATRTQAHAAMGLGIAQSIRSGVTLVGDITRWPVWTREVLAASPLRGVSFGEVIAIGSLRHRLAEHLDAASSTDQQTTHMRVGISPHAPYTVEPEGMRACAERARAIDAPLCVHLAETPDEEPFTRRLVGPFEDYLRGLGVWDAEMPCSGKSPVELAQQTGVLGSRTLLAHVNYVNDDEIQRLAASGASVAYCPRTHAAFGHRPHRFRDMLAAGINVCVATDSLVSSPSLSILDELRFLRREHTDVPPQDLLVMGTLRGARALGFSAEFGSLALGKHADLAVIPLEQPNPSSGWASILESTQPPQAVYISGRLQPVVEAEDHAG
jgi:cytosine/adenosine deaminase-related metal-dependent hydrolase